MTTRFLGESRPIVAGIQNFNPLRTSPPLPLPVAQSSSHSVALALERSDTPLIDLYRRPLSAQHELGRYQPAGNPISAVQAISRMRGGAQSHLMLGDDGNLWVVKFRNNPQHLKVLTNEFIGTRIAEALGLSVPAATAIDVSDRLIGGNPQLSIDLGSRGRERCSSGLQFGSRYAGGLMPRQVVDYLADEHLQRVRNLGQFAGMLAFDKWTGNSDGRQAVFQRKPKQRNYNAFFIDQGFCLGAGDWAIRDAPLQGVFARNTVYSQVTGWDSFEPWLTSIEQFCPEILWKIAESVPPQWYGDDRFSLEKLIHTLVKRRSRVRELVEEFRLSDRSPFPSWKTSKPSYGRAMHLIHEEPVPVSESFPHQITSSAKFSQTFRLRLSFDSKTDSTSWSYSAVAAPSMPPLLPKIGQWIIAHSF